MKWAKPPTGKTEKCSPNRGFIRIKPNFVTESGCSVTESDDAEALAIADLARQAVPGALKVLVEIATDPRSPKGTRLEACKSLVQIAARDERLTRPIAEALLARDAP
jgi:hypothetical protein